MTAPPTHAPVRPRVTPEDLRPQFLLEDNVVFLNHGSFGACPKPVWNTYIAWQRQLERQPVEFFRRHNDLMAAARTPLAEYLNAGPDDLSYVVNATSGINVIARSFPLGPGDEILSSDLEYGAMNNTWEHLCQRFGASYVRAGISLPFTTKQAIVDAIWEHVSPRTKAIFVSHITAGTAIVMPVEEICRRARAEGILTIIDGAHSTSQLDLDLRAMDVDIYSGNCHKWLCAPKGSAFLYVHPDQQEWIESLTISWGWGPESTFLTRNERQGTRDISAFLSVPRAIEFQRENNWPAVRADCQRRLSEFKDMRRAKTDIEPLSPNTSEWFSQMALVEVRHGGEPAMLKERFLTGYNIEIPFMQHNGITCVRLSVQGYVSDGDLARLDAALDEAISA